MDMATGTWIKSPAHCSNPADMLNPGSLVGLPTGTALGGSAIEHHQQRFGSNVSRGLENVVDRLIYDDGSKLKTPQVARKFWSEAVSTFCWRLADMGMDQYLFLPFLVG